MKGSVRGVAEHARRVGQGHIARSYLGMQRVGEDPFAIFRGFPPDPAHVAAQLVFGGCAYHEDALAMMGNVSWPLLWLQGDSCDGRHVAGTQALTVQGVDIKRLEWKGRVVGSCWSDDDADYCLLAGVAPSDLAAPRETQARQVFDSLDYILALAGMGFNDVVRTWLFLDRLLDWYGEFNAVRTAFFEERGVFKHLVPASTGIGAANPAGAALAAGAFAIRPKHPGVKIMAVDSPLQCSALNYRSSFSRAVEIRFSDRRHLMISGTASIAPDGGSVHLDDVPAQIDLTMRVVEAILKSRGMDWNSAVRGIAYFQRMGDAPLLAQYCEERGIRNLPVINAHATVCRTDLLFEIEIDAIAFLDGKKAKAR